MLRIGAIVSSTPPGASSAAARSSAALSEPRRRLPAIPISFVTTTFRQIWSTPSRLEDSGAGGLPAIVGEGGAPLRGAGGGALHTRGLSRRKSDTAGEITARRKERPLLQILV